MELIATKFTHISEGTAKGGGGVVDGATMLDTNYGPIQKAVPSLYE